MADVSQNQTLNIQVKGADKVKELADAYELVPEFAHEALVAAKSLDQQMAASKVTIDQQIGAYELLSESVADFRRQAIPLDDVNRESIGTYEVLSSATRTVGKEVENTGKAAGRAKAALDKLTGANRDMGRATLEAGRVLQDFTQGGIAGVLNNVEGLVSALGGTAGLAGLVTGVGVAAYVAAPYVKDLFSYLTSGANEVPKTTDVIGKMSEALETAATRLEELKSGYGLTNTELAEYQDLQRETLRLEKEISDAREREAGLAKARKEEADADLSPEGAKAFKAASDRLGGTDAVVAEVRNALNQSPEIAAARERAGQALTHAASPEVVGHRDPQVAKRAKEAAAKAQADLDALTRANEGRASDLVLGARGGNKAAIEEVAGLLPIGGFGAATEAGLAREAERQAAIKRQQEQDEADRKAAEERRKANEKRAQDDADEEAAMLREEQALQAQRQAQDAKIQAAKAAGEKAYDDRQRKAAQASADKADHAALAGIAQREYGFSPSESMLDGIVKDARALNDLGAAPAEAARTAIDSAQQKMLQAMNNVAGVMGDLANSQQTMAAKFAEVESYMQAIRSQQQVTRSRLRRGSR